MTNTQHQSEDVQFEELLKNFIDSTTEDVPTTSIASHFSSEATDEDKDFKLDSFTYKESTYYHPALDDAKPYSLIDLTLMFQGEKTTSKKRKKHFVLSETPEHEIRLHISSDDITSFGLSTVTPIVFLYREGTPYPLSSAFCTETEEKDEQTFCMHTNKPLAAGRYFLYLPGAFCLIPKHKMIDIDSGLCCAFQLLPHGKLLGKPSLDHALLSVKWSRKTAPDAWNRGTLQIIADLAWSNDSTTEMEYSLFCFNQDLALMGRPMICGKVPSSTEIHLKSRKPWMPGTYTTVAVCNREPLATIMFEITPTGEIEYAQLEDLSSDDFYYKYVRTLENPTLGTDNRSLEMPHFSLDQWNGWDICEIQGLGEEKRKLLHLYLSRQLAENNKHQRSSEVILFTGEDEETALQTVKQCEKILSVGRKSLLYIDVADKNKCRFLSNGVLREQCNDRAFILYNNHHLLEAGNPLLKVLQDLFLHPKRGITFVLCLSESSLKTLQKLHPEIVGEVGEYKHIHTARPSMTEQAYNLLKAIQASSMKFPKELQSYMLQTFAAQWEACHLSVWTDYEKWLKETVEPALCKRIGLQTPANISQYKVIQADLQLEAYWHMLRGSDPMNPLENTPLKRAFEAAMCQLNEMVGLQSLKDNLTDLFTLIQFTEQRRKLGLPSHDKVPRHLIFTGNPGTGKTTVAKLFGKIYHSLGLLSQEEVVVTERSQLVGEHIGSTEEKTRAILAASKGKVLFIDEAYTLCDSTDSRIDYGYRVIETLLTTLGEEGSDRVIILAGYKEEMQRLLEANRGLESRFNAHYEFEDYKVDELMQIAENKLTSECYQLTPAARQALLQLISEALSHKNPHFGNARWMLHRIENGIMPAMARRVMNSEEKEDLTLYTHILEEDVLSAKETSQLTAVKSRPKIGFVA